MYDDIVRYCIVIHCAYHRKPLLSASLLGVVVWEIVRLLDEYSY